jgi:hypothetical protein
MQAYRHPLCAASPVDDAAGVQVCEAPGRVQRHAPPAVAPQQRRPQHCVAEQAPQVAPRAVPARNVSIQVVKQAVLSWPTLRSLVADSRQECLATSEPSKASAALLLKVHRKSCAVADSLHDEHGVSDVVEAGAVEPHDVCVR